MAVDVRGAIARGRNARDKALWGMRVVGPVASLRGAVRLANLRVRRPERSRVRVGSGFDLDFSYPDQLPVALIAFGDLIDPEYPFLRAISSPDWVVADVGAAIGQFTVFAASLPVAKVYAFEPGDANLVSLRANAQLNQVADKVDVHPLALSDYEGRATFVTSGHTWVGGIGDSTDDTGGTASAEVAQVEVRRLDVELERLSVSRLDVLKINVAGYEPRVLDGAERFLARGGADVLVLLLGVESFDRYARLATYGYRFFFFHPRRGELHEVTTFDATLLAQRPWPARHIIAIHEEALSAGVGSQFQRR